MAELVSPRTRLYPGQRLGWQVSSLDAARADMNREEAFDVTDNASRALLVGVLEEDAMAHLLRRLVRDFGGDAASWFREIQGLERRGVAEAYRYGEHTTAGETAFVDVPLAPLTLATVEDDAFLFLCATPLTIPEILRLPPPAVEDPLRIIGLWQAMR